MKYPSIQHLIWLLLIVISSGCGLNDAILKTGGNGRMGVLLNYSCGAHPGDPIDPSKPTIVITHGWNPLPKRTRTTFACAASEAIKCRCGNSYNLLSWDWNAVKVSPFNGEPFRIGRCQGKKLASALRAHGVNPRCTQFIGHSLGTLIVSQAAVCLRDLGPTAQLTLLDPPTSLHEEIFCRLKAHRHACHVENYWAPRLSGYGDDACYPGVRNYNVGDGQAPILGVVDLSRSNHVEVMRWYYRTIRNPCCCCGFQKSVFLGCCGKQDCCEGCNPYVDARVVNAEVVDAEVNADVDAKTLMAGSAKSEQFEPLLAFLQKQAQLQPDLQQPAL